MKINLNDYVFEYGKVVSNPAAAENNRSFSLINNSDFIIKKWAIDKVIFKDRNEERCDYLLLVERKEDKIYYWIELKGNDITKGCKQILKTIELIFVEENAKQEARIVTTKTHAPDFRNINYIKLSKQMLRLGGKLKVYTNQGSERI